MNHLNPVQEEQLKEIGSHLRQLRQEQSISTEEVAAKTFIPSRLLKALEEGESGQLPEPVFIQGFIRRYADALNLDGTALAKTFSTDLMPVRAETFSQEISTPPSRLTIQPYIPYMLLLVAAGSGLLYLLNRPQAQPEERTKNATLTQLQKSPTKPSAARKDSKAGSPIEVTVSLKGQSWLQVVSDGKTLFKGVAEKGKQQTWTAQKELTFIAGNPGAVLISSKGKEQKPLGKTGQATKFTFTSGK